MGLCTQAEANHHILRLYDIRRRDPKAFASLDLLPFSPRVGFEGEMNVGTFSPDQLYLALARNDNYIHIYDRRMLRKQSSDSEPLFKYCHFGESKAVTKNVSYGVVQAQWLQSPWTTRTCLVTGGEDGERTVTPFKLPFLILGLKRMYKNVGPLNCCSRCREWESVGRSQLRH